MQAFTKLTGKILVLEQENIDTDQIIPARFLTATDFNGIGDHAFADWRTDGNGEPIADHVLNQERAHNSPILVGGHNFGCGSSREHAPIAIKAAGMNAVIAKSFARIHWQNLCNFGILPLTFSNPDDYEKIKEGDVLAIENVRDQIQQGNKILIRNKTQDKACETEHTLSKRQIEMVLQGSLINLVK